MDMASTYYWVLLNCFQSFEAICKNLLNCIVFHPIVNLPLQPSTDSRSIKSVCNLNYFLLMFDQRNLDSFLFLSHRFNTSTSHSTLERDTKFWNTSANHGLYKLNPLYEVTIVFVIWRLITNRDLRTHHGQKRSITKVSKCTNSLKGSIIVTAYTVDV